MQESSKEYIEYKSFDELPEELREKFKSGGKLSNSDRVRESYVDFINLLNRQGDKLVGDYVGATTKTQVKFGRCRHVANINSSDYKSGKWCGVCRGLQVQQGINDLVTTHPSLAKEWHPTKNDITPHNVTQGSNKKVWWQCEEHGHEWEATVANRVGGRGCPYCSNKRVLEGFNDIATTHSQYILYFVNIKDAYTHTHSSRVKVELKCPDCGNTKTMKIDTLTRQGFSCGICSDGLSYSEKMMALILTKLNIDFIKQLSYDNGEHKYDFYLPKHSTILETHGIQHYKQSRRGRSLEEEQKNDKYKRELAISNGILNENYHEVDCRYGTLEWCRPNIERALGNYVDISVLTEEDWKQADIQAQKSLKVEVCKYWNENKRGGNELSAVRLSEVWNIPQSTIWNYLNWGKESGLCTYDGKQYFKRRSTFIYLIKPNGDKWFKEAMSMSKLSKETGISRTVITNNLDKGSLKHHSNSKYDPKYIGSYIVSADVYDNQTQSN